jgi:hypothetical protein
MIDKLRPCPFCGSERIAVGSDKGTVYRHNTAFGDLTRSVPTVRLAYCVDCGCVAPTEKVNNFDGFYKPDEQEDALNRAISTWNRRVQSANEPLTLSEIYDIDSEPLYFHCMVGHWSLNGWHIVKAINYDGAQFKDVQLDNSDANIESLYNYGITWLAYRRKPERSEG